MTPDEAVTWLDDAEREMNEFRYADGLHPDTFRRLIKVARAAEALINEPYTNGGWGVYGEGLERFHVLRDLLREDEP